MNTIPSSCKTPLFAGNKEIKFGDREVPQPGPGQLLLRVHANALCGSERSQFFNGSTVTPGHEAAGTVVATGSGTSTPIGASGAVYLMDFCGECRSCRLGFTNQCMQKRADMGFNRDGGYGQYELIHENIFFPVPDEFSAVEATLLLDVMGTGSHAIGRCQMVRPDIESLLVVGAGPIGLAVLAMAKIILSPQLKVFITDIIPYRLKLAGSLGGLPVNVKDAPLQAGLKAHGVEQLDIAVDTTGRGAPRRDAFDLLARRGSLICIGHGEGLNLAISPDIIAPERSIVGSEYFRFDELPPNLRRLRQHRAYLSQIITHRMPVDEIENAFQMFFHGETGKVVIEQ